MAPVLFYIPGTCAFGSIVSLEWLCLPFHLCRLDNKSIKSDSYLRLNPLSQVPTLKYQDVNLTESAAILQHIGFLGISKGLAYKQGTQKFDELNSIF